MHHTPAALAPRQAPMSSMCLAITSTPDDASASAACVEAGGSYQLLVRTTLVVIFGSTDWAPSSKPLMPEITDGSEWAETNPRAFFFDIDAATIPVRYRTCHRSP